MPCRAATSIRLYPIKEGRESTADLPRSGRSVSANKDASVAVVEEDMRWTVLELAQHTGIPASSVRLILRQDLNVRKIAAKCVLHHLTEVQKWTRYEIYVYVWPFIFPEVPASIPHVKIPLKSSCNILSNIYNT